MSDIQALQSLEAVQQASQNKKKTDDTVYQQLLNQQLNSLMDMSQQVGQSNSLDAHDDLKSSLNSSLQSHNSLNNSLKSNNSQKSPIDQHTKDMIDHGPIFLAILMVLMTGPNSGYHTLAKTMSNISQILNDLKKFTDLSQKIQDDINDFMKGNGNLEDIAKDLAMAKNKLQAMLDDPQLVKELGGPDSEMVKDISDFVKDGGALDQVVSDATGGLVHGWNDLAWGSDPAVKDPEANKQIQDYLTNKSGGAAGQAATGVFKNMTDLLGGLSTQNSAQMEELNIVTKKVDADTKLVSAAMEIYKSLIPVLTNYSGS